MAKVRRLDINPDDYLDTELGYDMPVKTKGSTKAEPVDDMKGMLRRRKSTTDYNPDDFSETELGYEYEAGQEALE
ncbi:hypothetical protein ACFLVR_02530 [Chloroflexota bacterium]